MPRWRTDPATRRERRPSRRVMPPKRSSPRDSRKLVGPSWPGTSMSVATSSISWRSTRVLPPRWSSSRCAGGPVAGSACPRRPSTIGSGRGSGGRVRAPRPRSLPDGSPVPRLPLRFDLVVVEPEGRVRHHRHACRARRRHPGSGPRGGSRALRLGPSPVRRRREGRRRRKGPAERVLSPVERHHAPRNGRSAL